MPNERAQARLLETCPAPSRNRLRSLFVASQRPRYVHPSGNTYWRRWGRFAYDVGQHPFLPGLQGKTQHLERSNLFMAFAVALRRGQYHNGGNVSSATVAETLRWCAGCMVEHGLADPRRTNPGQHHLDQCFSKQLDKWKQADPAPKPQQALPSSTVQWIARQYALAATQRMRVVGDLIVLAFFFLLRIGEYTKSSGDRRTIPLRRQDIRLWRGTQIMPHGQPLDVLLTATGVTVHLENQKNGNKNAVLHHYSSGVPGFDPVQSAARLVFAIQHLPPGTPLGTFLGEDGQQKQASADNIRTAIRIGAVGDNLASCGYNLNQIGSHSLRSGGAVHLKLAGYDDDMVKKLGRWSSNTYLRYIQSQIAQLTMGVATSMARILQFHNVGV
jgi:hypothetical protein